MQQAAMRRPQREKFLQRGSALEASGGIPAAEDLSVFLQTHNEIFPKEPFVIPEPADIYA